MRGRKAEVLTILTPDLSELERVAHSDASPWYQVRSARIVLGIAAGQRREDLASQLECDDSTIWRTCQRYRYLGLVGLLADKRQSNSGRDIEITPVQRAQIVGLACLDLWPKDCTSHIGRVTTLPAKRWRMGLWLTLANAPCEIS